MQVSSQKLPTAMAVVIRQFMCLCNQLATHNQFSVATPVLSVKKDLSPYFFVSFLFRGTEFQTRDFLNDSRLLYRMKQEQCRCFFTQTVEVT